jgi:SAM-dependent methyltransferase
MADPFLNFAGVESGQRVLDVGCGTGIITLALAQRSCTAVGVDASEANPTEPFAFNGEIDRSRPFSAVQLRPW